MSKNRKCAFAVLLGNRGFFPGFLMSEARKDLRKVLKKLGHEVLMTEPKATRQGAVETVEEGRKFAEFLQRNRGKYDGVILSLPNFGDENGAVAALRDAGVPILIQAYPDELDKMSNEQRRDAFCGKFSIMDVFRQCGIPFTILPPHTCHPRSKRFAETVDYFSRLCRVVSGMKRLRVGAIGARTSAFKTVRIDEVALERRGVTMETFDLSDVFAEMEKLDKSSKEYKAKTESLKKYATWKGVPNKAFDRLTRLGVVLDRIIVTEALDCLSVRCWLEMQKHLGISPCVLLSEMNNRGLPAACEVDVGNAVTMKALTLASGDVAACLDWNNNYGDDDDKCVLFHCGPAPQKMMVERGRITDHEILANAVGKGCGYGCDVGRLAPTPFTAGSLLTEDGRMKFFLCEGRFTDDPIPEEFFGVAGVAWFDKLQDKLQRIGYGGYRHHVSVTPGKVMAPLVEAFEKYLDYDATVLP